MRTASWTVVYSARPQRRNRLFTVFALLAVVLAPQTTVLATGLRLGDHMTTPQLGHGVAEGNGPTGLYGFFGCLFSFSVCQRDEICVNDNLFGSCQRIGSAVDEFQYSLSDVQLRQLEDEVERLVEGGYKWTDLYTQCVLGNVLLAFELNQHYDADFCKHKARPTTARTVVESFPLESEDLEEVLGVPESRLNNDLFKGYDYDDGGASDDGAYRDFLFPKRSEEEEEDPMGQFFSRRMFIREVDPAPDQSGALDFVAVHKYQKNRKRQSLIGQLRRRLDSSRSRKKVEEEEEDGVGRSRTMDFLSSLTPRELDQLEMMVSDGYVDRRDRNERINAADQNQDQDQDQEGAESTFDPQPTFDLGQKRDEDGEETAADQEEEVEEEEPVKDDEVEEDEELERDSSIDPDDAAAFQIGEEGDEYYDVVGGQDFADQDKRRLVFNDDVAAADAAAGRSDAMDDDDEPVVDAEALVDEKAPDNTDETDQSMVSEWSAVRTIEGGGGGRGGKLAGGGSKPDESEPQPNVERIPDTGFIVKPSEEEADELVEERRAAAERATTLAMMMESMMTTTTTSKPKYDIVDANYAYLSVMPKTNDPDIAGNLVTELQDLLQLPSDSFSDLSVYKGDINFRINHNQNGLNASTVAAKAISFSNELKNKTGLQIVGAGVGHVSDAYISVEDVKTHGRKYFLLTFILCGVIAGVVLAVILLYVIRRHRMARQKLVRLAQTTAEKAAPEVSKDYQELCRHHMQSKLSEKPEPLHVSGRVGSVSAIENAPVHSPSSRSSTSSWSEEPVTTSMDISTGHIVLSYMEDHLKNKDRLDEEWQALCAYEPEVSAVTVASLPQSERKNRYSDILPYDHSRVVLHAATNMTGSDYINATTIMDHDPRNPAYLATQGPLPNTVADFWQMIWEQGSVVIVNLTKLTEQGTALCHCYWPSEGSDLYHIYEVHLVSEHIWCDDYLVRSFYLKNLQTNETRTVTQFHFLTWSDMKVPGSSKALLDFRRKVNKSYRGRSCPILVHCSDGAGRSGTYCLIDMVLNRMTKGAKEIDIAATLEHIRDQRMQMVKTKEQFQFVLATVAEEVHAILKALPQ